MEKIKSITEAFSMQPVTISTMESNDAYYDKPSACKEIKLEVMDEDTNVYVGYNFEGKKIFQYLANSVNVHYDGA